MSDVQNRPSARGRVSARGGRGGYSNRGGRGGSSRSNADSSDLPSFDEGEIGQMKKKYSDTLPTLRELFPDWKDEDLAFALEDSNGDLEEAIERITEGNVSQWGEVKKKTTDRTRPKAKEVQSTSTEPTAASVRGARGRGGFEGRGRARGDRGRGGRGGRAGAQAANGARVVSTAESVPAVATVAETEPVTSKAGEEAETESAAVDSEPKTSVIPDGAKKGWASLFAKPAPPPPQKKPPQAAPAPAPAPAPIPEKPVEPVPKQKAPEPAPVPAAAQKTPVAKPTVPAVPTVPVIPATAGKQHKGDLTETNLEQIPDVSAPAPTATAASTVGSGIDPAAAAASGTPSRAPPSSLPGSAYKQGVRAPGFQRRVMEQQQAVVMPGNHAVDRAAVQFGSMGLNGDSVDIDENREEAETRTQPPQHSPVAPRAALPPTSQGSAETGAARPAPGLPPVPQASVGDSSFSEFGRYSEAQKPYDPFNPQISQPQQQIPEPFANQAPAQPAATTGSEYAPFYAADQRFPYYNNNYGSYGQSQDASAAPRAAPGFGVSGAEAAPQVPASQAPTRYGPVDATNSGHNTPNPTLPGATQAPAAQQHMAGQSAYGYGYNPYYSSPHYAQYMNQMNQQQYGRSRPMYDDARRYDEQQQQQQQQQQQHYGMPHNNQYGYGNQYGPYGGKGGMYGQPHGGFSYDHASSPANTAASFNQTAAPGRDSVYSARTSSAQPADSQQSATGANAFSTGMSDVFARSQAGGFGQTPSVAQQPPVATEETKGFEAPKAGGPSPSLTQANRPGSATNNVPGQAQGQTGLPQQGQQAFGGYGHLNPQYAGLGGLGGHQGNASQTGGYNYGAGFGNYYGNNRGGWGNNYGH
ncbi:hypothetical protein N7478_003327 [Penicillium angulare]|uniref:uncharacterized protein n=1 Tax=Penicillium angulare TaxID=116970 RepID=UPI0025417C4F|nr:uncharacterized protein N7478_003327 [Penicillium angulare]KAJ5287641.1 hypothetical protein N7478_003327 [Penicillium angulare]